jgi:hypothetical protein
VKVVASNDPDPFAERETLVALPPNVFPGIVNGVVPQVLSLARLSCSRGGFTQPQLTENIGEIVTQPCGMFMTAI